MGETPDASSWSVADVAQYFTDVGFVAQAETFRAEASISCMQGQWTCINFSAVKN